MNVTARQITAIARSQGAKPRPDLVEAIVRGWPEARRVAKLTTRNRAAAFLGQIMTETGGLQILVESGAYRFETICKIFGEPTISRRHGGRGHSARIGEAEARSIAALPVSKRGPRLFDRVYGIGNPSKAKEFGHTKPGQGWLYRGGGMMQTTGLNNYRDKAKKTGLPLVEHPELLQTPDPAFKAAYLEWGQDGRANRTADALVGGGDAEFKANRKVINGGYNGLAEFKKYYAAAMRALDGYESAPAEDDDDIVGVDIAPIAPAEPEPVPVPEPRPQDAPPNVVPLDEPDAVGDLLLYHVQRRLKERRYSPGSIDGRWGGGISGALSAFRNDRGIDFPMPRNLEQFHDVVAIVRAELDEAEAEAWFRPVSEERAKADPTVVKELAPETVPAKRNFIASAWAAFLALVGSIWNTVSGYVMDAWNFFTDHRDVVDDHPGIMSTVTGYAAKVPVSLWLLLAAGAIGYVALNSWTALKTSTNAVRTGERQ